MQTQFKIKKEDIHGDTLIDTLKERGEILIYLTLSEENKELEFFKNMDDGILPKMVTEVEKFSNEESSISFKGKIEVKENLEEFTFTLNPHSLRGEFKN